VSGQAWRLARAAAPAAAVAAAAPAASGSFGVSGAGGAASEIDDRDASACGASGAAASASCHCGCATATINAEKRIMKKLDAIVKQSLEDRKSDEKVNKVTRQEVTAMAAELKMVKKRTGKLAKSMDTAQGDLKRSSEGLDALNKHFTVSGAGNGASGTELAGPALATAAVGNTQPGFFSGEPQMAPWVKSMVVYDFLLRVHMALSCGRAR